MSLGSHSRPVRIAALVTTFPGGNIREERVHSVRELWKDLWLLWATQSGMQSIDRRRLPRRQILQWSGVLLGVGSAPSLAGCSILGADHASYWSDSYQLDVDYDAVMTAARDAGYTVEEPYYVGATEPQGIHPSGFADFDERFGPEYRVFGITFYPSTDVFVEFLFTPRVPTVALGDERGVDEFPVSSFPPEEWLHERLSLVFDISASAADEYAEDLRSQVAEGSSNPTVGVDAPVTFERAYEAIESERTDAAGSATGGDGWYKETSSVEGRRFAVVDVVVQSLEVRHEDARRTYTLKLDRLGGLYLTIRLPVGEEIPEDEYRATFRQLFEDVGLPADVVDELNFEYSGSVW